MIENEVIPYISIDPKKFRLRIHKQTLSILGIPDHIQLLIDPKQHKIAIQAIDKKTRTSHKIKFEELRSDSSYELYSTFFIRRIQEVAPWITSDFSYRFRGELHTDHSLVLFSLKDAQRIETEVEPYE